MATKLNREYFLIISHTGALLLQVQDWNLPEGKDQCARISMKVGYLESQDDNRESQPEVL